MLDKRNIKDFVGKTIWVIPRGNAVKRNQPLEEQIEEVELISTGSKFMELKQVTKYSRPVKYYIDGSYNNNNYGYLPFATKKDVENYFQKNIIIKNLLSNYGSELKKLSFEEILEIQNIVDKKHITHEKEKSKKKFNTL